MHRSRPADPSGIAAADKPDAASRRRFLQLFAAASAAPWAHALTPGLGRSGSGLARAQTAATEETPATVRALVDLVKAHWGERLTAEDLLVIEENLGWMQRSSQALRSAPLQNSDEPDVIFRAEAPEDS